MENYAPVSGSPIIPPSYLTVYFIVFLVILSGLYFYFSKKRQPLLLWHKVRLLVVLAAFLKVFFVLGAFVLVLYWLLPTPNIRRIVAGQTIEIVFDRPVSRANLEKNITPSIPGRWVFEDSIYTTHLYRKLVFYPTYSLSPDTNYKINLSGIENLIKYSDPYDYEYDFLTPPSPEVASVFPSSGSENVAVNQKIKVELNTPNLGTSEFDFELEPSVDFDVSNDFNKQTYTLSPKGELDKSTQYRLRIKKTDLVLNLDDNTVVERGETKIIYDGTFVTTQKVGEQVITLKSREPIEVIGTTPEDSWTGVGVNTSLAITFDRLVNQTSAKSKFKITPNVDGGYRFEGTTMTFDPSTALSFSTLYEIVLDSGIQSPEGANSNQVYKIKFRTQDATTKLSVPSYLQKYSLSCELSALRMALSYRGVNVSEDTLLEQVGVDPTSHNGDIWGNPNSAFVGNVRGKQMVDGYGVHWVPIARVAKTYRSAEAFQGWDISTLNRAVDTGNPVVIWVYSRYGTPTSWNTPDGQNIYAVRDEHAVVVVGFVGPPDNPSQMIINDPLSGQVYWSRSVFDRKWNIFGRSGVVIY